MASSDSGPVVHERPLKPRAVSHEPSGKRRVIHSVKRAVEPHPACASHSVGLELSGGVTQVTQLIRRNNFHGPPAIMAIFSLHYALCTLLWPRFFSAVRGVMVKPPTPALQLGRCSWGLALSFSFTYDIYASLLHETPPNSCDNGQILHFLRREK